MKKSESIKNIAIALAKFQGEVKNPANSKTVSVTTKKGGKYSYSYSPLDEVLNVCRPILAKNGLSIIQNPTVEERRVMVTTILLHNSGEYIEFAPITLEVKETTAQDVCSAITYARRYALSSILGISSEDDDDGNIASEKSQTSGYNSESKNSNNYYRSNTYNNKAKCYNNNPNGENKYSKVDTISEKQAARLFYLANKDQLIVNEALKQIGVEHTTDIPKKYYEGLCKYVQRLTKFPQS